MFDLPEELMDELGLIDDVSCEVQCKCDNECGCVVEYDGKCQHGCVSKMRAMGMI